MVVPWGSLCALTEPHYPSGERRCPPIGIERMLRITFLQHWFKMSDPQAEDSLYDSAAMRNFLGIDLGNEVAPDSERQSQRLSGPDGGDSRCGPCHARHDPSQRSARAPLVRRRACEERHQIARACEGRASLSGDQAACFDTILSRLTGELRLKAARAAVPDRKKVGDQSK